MATKEKGVVRATAFPAGSTVKLYDRVGDFFAGAGLGKPAASKKVPKDGEVEFDGLRDGSPFWAVAEGQAPVRVTAKEPTPVKERTEPVTGPQAAQTVAGPTHPHEVVEGARSTVTAREHRMPTDPFASKAAGQPTPKDEREPEPVPHPRIEDQKKSAVLRSDTATGEAHIAPPDEPQPKPRQEDVKKGTVQRSDTETGEATPIPKGEQVPAVSQEDAPKGAVQRSDTEFGSFEPVTSSGEKAEVESSKGKAEGQTPAKPKAKTTGKASTKSSTAKRSAAAKKAAATRKRNSKKNSR